MQRVNTLKFKNKPQQPRAIILIRLLLILGLVPLLALLLSNSFAEDQEKIDFDSAYTLKFASGNLVVDGEGNLYVGDNKLGKIEKYKSDGSPLTSWSSGKTGEFGIYSTGQNIFVKTADGIVQKFDETGNLITKINLGAESKGIYLAVDVQGNIYTSQKATTEQDSFTVQKFNNQGKPITSWDLPKNVTGAVNVFGQSIGPIAVSQQGFVFVVQLAPRAGSNIFLPD